MSIPHPMGKKALDLFCGAGGASMGLHQAGYEVTGVDIHPQPEYPFTFILADALSFDLTGFDLIWASPPCQRYSAATRQSGKPEEHPDLIDLVRDRLKASGTPYAIENVLGAPLRDPITLCGATLGLGVIRHRLIETSWLCFAPEHPKHKGSLVTGEYLTVAGNGGVPAWTLKEREKRGLARHRTGEMKLKTWQKAMGIDWMSRKALSQAIPPAYSHYIALLAP